MGQMVIDFVHGDESTGLAGNHAEFVGERVPDISEAMADDMKHLTGPDSDLALTIKNAKTFMETLNNSQIPQVIKNTAQFTDTLKREPWRLLWPATKSYPGDETTPPVKKK
jgi:hypothetical protein